MLVLFSRSRVVLTRFDYLSAAIFTYLTTTLSSSNTDVSSRSKIHMPAAALFFFRVPAIAQV